MDNQLKQRITRIFRSSFESCRSKHITDVIESAVLPAAADDHHQLIHLFSPKKHTPPCPSFPCSSCKPKLPDSFNTDDSCIVRKKSCLISDNREKLQLQLQLLDGQKCPPASPITPFFNFQNQNPLPPPLSKNRVKKRINSKRGRRIRSSRTRSYGMNDFPACSYNGLFSSDEDDEDDDDDDDNTTFFSSRSLSSESSRSFRQGNRSRRVLKEITVKEEGKDIEESCATEEEGKVEEDSFAVVKRSNDPYSDFRTSMEEMIIEKQIFTANDLEDLLQCFLSLNSSRHHRVIVQVFNDIWDALFS